MTDREMVEYLISKIGYDKFYNVFCSNTDIEVCTGYGGISFEFDEKGDIINLENNS